MHVQVLEHEQVHVPARTCTVDYLETVVSPFMHMSPKFRPIRARLSEFHTSWNFGMFENSMYIYIYWYLYSYIVHVRVPECTLCYVQTVLAPFMQMSPKFRPIRVRVSEFHIG